MLHLGKQCFVTRLLDAHRAVLFVPIEDRQPHGHGPVRVERPELGILMPGEFHSVARVLAED
jgi:hypothetical protein